MGIQINGNNDIISALDGSWTAEGASINTSGILTATTFKGNIVGTAATFTGPVTIGGTLTYEDVTNIDSIGIITARAAVSIADSIVHTGDTNTSLRFPANDTVSVETAGNERLRIASDGRVVIGDDHFNNAFTGGDSLVIGNEDNGTRSGITLVSASNSDGGLYFSRGGSSNSEYVKGQIVYNHTNDYMAFYTSGTNRAFNILSGGDVCINRTGQIEDAKLSIQCDATQAAIGIQCNHTNTDTDLITAFNSGGKNIVNITAETDNSPYLKFEILSGNTAVERFRVNHLGNVAIGGGTAPNRLEIINDHKGFAGDSAQPNATLLIKHGTSGSNRRWVGIGASLTGAWLQSSSPGGSGLAAPFWINKGGGDVTLGNDKLKVANSGGIVWIGSFTQYGNSAFNASNGGIVATSSGQNTLKLIDSTAQAANVGARILLGGNYRSSGDASPFVELKSFKENGTDNNYAYGFKISTTPNGGSLEERIQIKSNGQIGVNMAPSADAQFCIKNSDDSNYNVFDCYNDNGNKMGGFSQDSTGNGTVGVRKNDGDLNVLLRSSGNSYVKGGRLLIGTDAHSISSSEMFEVKHATTGFSYFENDNTSGYAPIYINNKGSNSGFAPIITITDGSGNRGGLGLNSSETLRVHGQGGVEIYTGGTMGGGTQHWRINNLGDLTHTFPGRHGHMIGSTDGSGAYLLLDGAEGNPLSSGTDYMYMEHTSGGNFEMWNGNGSVSTTKFMEVSPAGQIKNAKQPSFAAYRSQSGWSVGSGDEMVFNATRHNIGSHYSTSTGRFTAPVAGSYLFTFFSIHNTNVNSAYIRMFKNGARIYGSDIHFTYDQSGHWDNVAFSQIIYLSASDYVSIYNGNPGVNYHGNHWQQFCGYLLG